MAYVAAAARPAAGKYLQASHRAANDESEDTRRPDGRTTADRLELIECRSIFALGVVAQQAALDHVGHL